MSRASTARANAARAPTRLQAVPAADLPADPESRAHDDHHDSLRVWLRLLTCTMMVERQIRARLRTEFATTLPRFDLMAQLERNPAGLKMGELSQRLMVTGGNVTSLTDQLVTEGLVERRPIADDRRAYAVRLTPKGKRSFDAMAVAHEQWVVDMLGGLDAAARDRLYALLGRLKETMPVRDTPAKRTAKDAPK